MEGDRVGAGLDELARPGARGARSSGARRASPPAVAHLLARAPPTTSGPTVIGGTKCPSITSTWITRAPASSTSPTCSRSRPKSAERIDGATRTPPSSLARRRRSYRPAASSRRSCCTSGSPSRTSSRSSSARRSSGTPRSARSGAGSRRSGSGPGRLVGRSHGSPQFGHCGPRSTARLGRGLGLALHRSAPAQAGDEEAGGAVAVRAASAATPRRARAGAQAQRGQLGGEVVEAEVGVGVKEGGDQALVLSRRDRASRVDKHASRTERAGAGARGSPPARAPSPRPPPASRASAGRRAPAACRAPSRAGRRARGRTRPLRPRERAASATSTRTLPARRRCAVRASAPARRGVALDRDDLPAALHQRGEMGALAARRGAQVEHPLARARIERARDEHRRARLRHEARPRATAASRGRRTGPPARAPRGCRAVAVRRAHRAASRGERSRGVGDERVRAQRQLAGLVVARHQRPGAARRRAPPTTARAIHSGMGVLDGRLLGRVVGERRRAAPRPRARRGAARR